MNATSSLTVRISRETPAAVVIEAVGDIDLATAPRLRAALLDAAGRGSVVLDAARIAFCDLAGLRVLLETLQFAEDRGRGFRLADPSVAVTRVLEITGTLALFAPAAPG